MSNNALGGHGEALFCGLITEFHSFPTEDRPVFAPAYLGEKWEAADFIVELVGASGVRPFFFVQVKTTRRGYSADNTRLNVKMKREDVRRLSLYPAPTYVVGMNALDKKGYIISANGETAHPLSSMSMPTPLMPPPDRRCGRKCSLSGQSRRYLNLHRRLLMQNGSEIMATMEANLVALRAEALVIVQLTDRPNVRVIEAQEDAVDLIAILCKHKEDGRIRFGIQVKPLLPESVDGAFARKARNGRDKVNRRIPSWIAFPVCETVVNVVSNEIQWRWVLEPACDEAGRRLRTNNELTLSPLTDEAMNAIVDSVNCWYNAD